MFFPKKIFLFIIPTAFIGFSEPCCAQNKIHGMIQELNSTQQFSHVNIQNIYTGDRLETDTNGHFSIIVKTGELLEISKEGYKTLRIRILNEAESTFYNLTLERLSLQLNESDVKGIVLDYKKDSINYENTYGHIIHRERKGDIDFRAMPLAMLSKRNREAWAFQEMYDKWQQEKYVDFVYNEALVNRITYLQGEELRLFMAEYKPSYQFVRNASEYEFLEFIKKAFYQYKVLKP